MVSSGVTSNFAQVDASLKRKFQTLIPGNLRAALRKSAARWESSMKRDQFRPFRRTAYRDKLRIRSGGTRSNIGFRMFGRGLDSGAVLFAGGAHTRIQEFGGTIRGRPWLSIPLPDTLSSTGHIRSDLRTFQRGEHWQTARGERTFIRRSRQGNLIVFLRRGPNLIPLRVLKRSVRLPAGRLGFFRTWDEQRPERRATFAKAIRAARAGRRFR